MPLCSRVFVCDAMVLWCYGAMVQLPLTVPCARWLAWGSSPLRWESRVARVACGPSLLPSPSSGKSARQCVRCPTPTPSPLSPSLVHMRGKSPSARTALLMQRTTHAAHYSCTALTGTAATYIFSPPASPTVCSTWQVPVVPSTCCIPFTTPPPHTHTSFPCRTGALDSNPPPSFVLFCLRVQQRLT